jgi:hypothetical protein
MSGKMKVVLAALAAVAVASGCAKEREPRSYVQPNILAKRDLTGLWYYAPTVVDIGFGSSVTFIGETSMDVTIIKWDIQEKVLYARLAYDRIRGTEAEHNPLDDVAFKGEPIGAWAVSHFDIIRDYNATTGEETNVIRETTERPWYDREFLRVDWSNNLVSNWNWIWERVVRMDPINYFQTEPDHPHAPKIERNERGEATYIGITTKNLVTPEMREFGYYGWAEIPDCYFYGSTQSCTSTEVIVRHAFAKVDPDHEYQPREYTQKEQDDYGYFAAERKTYSRDYTVTVGGITWYANRFNLYKEWFEKAYDVSRAALHAGGRPFECSGGGEPCRYTDVEAHESSKVFLKASLVYSSADLPPDLVSTPNEVHCRCDGQGAGCKEPCFYVSDGTPVYREDPNGEHKLALRPRDQALKPIVYYLNETFPEDLLPAMRGVAAQWADVFNMTVWLAAGCSKADFEEWKSSGFNSCAARPEFSQQGFTMLMLCENPVVQPGDPPECGPVGREVRLGDIRYNHVNWVDAPQQSSPLGYGPPLGHPLTGETISAIANIYGSALDSYAVYTRDLVRMLTDTNFPWDDFLWARYQTEFVRRTWEQGSYEEPRPANADLRGTIPERHKRSWESRTYTQDDVRRMYRSMNKDYTRAIASSTPQVGKDTMSVPEVMNWSKQRLGSITRSSALGNGTNPQLARVNMLRDSYWEDLMMTPQWLISQADTLMAAGYDPESVTGADLPKGSDLRRGISPLTKGNIRYLKAINNIKNQHYAKKGCVMYPEMVPISEPSVIGVATEVVCTLCCADTERDGEGNCPGVDACKQSKAEQTNRWSDDSECGQRVKQRLREWIFDGVTIHEMGHNMGLRHNFKGTFDAMNYFDEYWKIRTERVQNDPAHTRIAPRAVQPRNEFENLSRVTDYQYTSIMDYGSKFNSDFQGLGRHDYASIIHTYGGFKQVFTQVEDLGKIGLIQNFRSYSWPTAIQFYLGKLPDGSRGQPPVALDYHHLYYHPEVNPEGAVDPSEANRNWVPIPWIVEGESGGSNVWMTDIAVEQKAGGSQRRIMVPYKFCSDEFRNSSLGCNYFDEGPDIYEINENQIQAYENNYVFNNFGRDRYSWGWDDSAYQGRIAGRYFELLQNHLQYYVLYWSIFHDWGYWYPDQIETFFTDMSDGWGTYTIAVNRGLETFGRVMNMPAPGFYEKRTRMNGEEYWFRSDEPQWRCDGDPSPTCENEKLACKNDTYGCFYVELQDGKFWDDTWDFDFGYQWYLRKIRIGQFYDRPIAVQLMAEASNNFMGRDTQEDVRLYTINYTRIFPNQINTLFSSIQSQSLEKKAPVFCGWSADNVALIEHKDFSNLGLAPCASVGGTPQGYVDPGDTFTTQLFAATWGMAMFPMNYSQEFQDRSRIFIKGNVEGLDFEHLPLCSDPADPPCRVEFTDPFSRKSYVSVRYPDEKVSEDSLGQDVMMSGSIGAEMLDEANTILGEYETYQTLYEADPTDIDAYNNMYVFRENLKNYVINLDMIRNMSYLFEHPDYTLNPQ